MTKVADWKREYRLGQAKLSLWCSGKGLRLVRREYHGLQQRLGDDWWHHSYTMYVRNVNWPDDKQTLAFPFMVGEKWHDLAGRSEPRLIDLVGCLISDLTDESFEDWCSEFGYDSDSMARKGMYEEVLRSNGLTRALFDTTDTAALRNEAAPYLEEAGL